jgi:YeeE/YedE family (DUF395).
MKTLAFLSGIVFGIGLLVSGMTDPAKVIAFLDIAGPWDPSLILVMVTAVVVALVPMQLAQRRADRSSAKKSPFHRPRASPESSFWGSAIFGIGWGMTGLCPGPSLASLAASTWQEWLFSAAWSRA